MIGSDPLTTEMSHSELASDALLSLVPPPLAPETIAEPIDHYSNSVAEHNPPSQPEPNHAKSSWLDAMPVDGEYEMTGEYYGIAAVNSDDNGLYRLFLGVSP